MSKDISAVIRAQVLIEISVGCWPSKTSFAELHEQVSREAKQTLVNRLQSEGLRIVSEPVIKASMYEEKT